MNEKKERLHFNKILQVCDWPWSAGCEDDDDNDDHSTTTEEPTTTTTEEPTTTTTTTEKPTTTTTEEPTTTTTEEPITTTPTDDFYTPSSTTPIIIIPDECPKGPGADEVKIPDKNDCKSYYVCHKDGTSHKETCEEDYVFDPRLQMCDWDDGTICSNFSTTTSTTTLKPTPKPGKCPPVDNPNKPIYYPHECDCNLYYVCENGKELKKYCPEDEGFDLKKKKCVPMSEAHCVVKVIVKEFIPTNNNEKITTKDSFFYKLFHWN